MRVTGRIGVCVALAITLTAWSGASAAAKPVLTLETARGPLSERSTLVMSSSNLLVETSNGNVECNTNVFTGTLTTNGANKDKGTVSETSFAGDESERRCKTTTPFGPGELVGSGFAWGQELTAKGTGKLKGSKRLVIAYVDPDDEIDCPLETGKINETFKEIGTTAEPLVIEMTRQTVKVNKRHTGFCPLKEAALSGTFAVTAEGEGVLAHT